MGTALPIREFCQVTLLAGGRMLGALSLVAGLALAGCAGRVEPQLAQTDPLETAGMSPPDMSLLAPQIAEAFKTTKLTGYPRVSSPRPAPISSLGDWIVCLTNDSETDRSVYAVFIRNSAVVDTRLAVVIDACGSETFASLPNP